jgi:site-specific recombinase XerC
VLDRTGNLVAVQHLLGHSNIATTGNNYVGWETDALHETMRDVIAS